MKALLLVGALTAAAMLLNPRGLDIIEYLRGFLESPAIQHIVTEWAPTSLGTTVGRLFAAYCVVVLVAGVLGRRRLVIVEVLIVMTFFVLALRSQRHILWFALASVPFSARHISAALTSRASRPAAPGSRAANIAIIAIIAAAVVAVLPPWKSRLPLAPHLRLLVSAETPVATVRFMQQDLLAPGRLFHSETTGSYLQWAAPERKIFVDSRAHLYPVQLLRDYQQLSAGNSVATLLEKYAIDGMHLENKRQSALLDWAKQQPDWELRFAEPCCTYLVKTTVTEPGQTR
jgi:hypothetical protein